MDPLERSTPRQSDHDLLVTIHTKLERALDDIRELKDGTAARITDLEEHKIDKEEFSKTFDDLEKRMKWLERIAYGGIGILGFIEFYYKVINR